MELIARPGFVYSGSTVRPEDFSKQMSRADPNWQWAGLSLRISAG